MERKPIEAYLDPDKVKKVYPPPKPPVTGYVKLCKFYKQARCRNGDKCPYEHRLPGEGWPENGPTESVESNAGGDDEDIGSPPTDEGVVDAAQEERDYLAFQRFNYGKGASKGEPMTQEPKRQLCLYYGSKNGCKYGPNCKFTHDDHAVLEGHREAGKKWDNASRKAIRDAGLHKLCVDYYLKDRCRVGYGCNFSHEQLSDDRLALLRHLVHVANHMSGVQDRGGELPSRSSLPPTATLGGSSSSSAPQALVMTNVSNDKNRTDVTLDGAEEQDEDEQKDSVAESSTTPSLSPDEAFESWMARNKGLWVYTPQVSEVMLKLGV